MFYRLLHIIIVVAACMTLELVSRTTSFAISSKMEIASSGDAHLLILSLRVMILLGDGDDLSALASACRRHRRKPLDILFILCAVL